MKTNYSRIQLNQLELNVNLGWPEKERAKKQKIHLDLCIKFPRPPRACVNDDLSDTVCYDTLSKLVTQLTKKEFKLLEHLAHEIYQLIKKNLPSSTLINLRLTKKPAVMKNLREGVSFYYGDEEWLF